ncbi:alpha/beta fold hydrolase [Chloroflexota bacterium]
MSKTLSEKPTIKRAYIDIPEGQIHYQIGGSGEPLLLLHQGMFSSDEFEKVMPLLAEDYLVIARDMLGYGISDLNPPDFTMEDYARADMHFLQALGINRVDIVGIHTGAKIAIEIAATNPRIVSKMVLYEVFLRSAEEREAARKSYTFSEIKIEEDGSHFISRLWKAVRRFGPNASAEHLNKVVVAAAMAKGGAYHGEHASFRHDTEKLLPLIKCPTLLISGTGEFEHQQMEKVRGLIPNCQTKTIENVDAFVAMEKPTEFAEATLDFFKKS